LVQSAGHVCCRYRLAAFRSRWLNAGHSLQIQAWPRVPWDWVLLGHRLRGTDAVILQRKLLSWWHLARLRAAASFLVFDFDDAVFLRDSFALKGLHSGRRLRRFAATMRAADVVVAGSSFLARQAACWAGAARVFQIPTCVEPDDAPVAEHVRSGAGVQLVWIGSASTLQGLQRARPLLESIGQRWPGLSLKLVCDRFLDLRHLPVLPCDWSESEEGAALAAADIGISWIPDDLWSRGKCGLKVLQYMAAGLPVVANPVGVHAELVEHGVTGFLATTEAQWQEAIGLLMHDPLLRRQLGAAGRRRVQAHYSVAVGADRWLDVLARAQPRRRTA
jgi:glycosyltransferase involved in cell wall biosynthesis